MGVDEAELRADIAEAKELIQKAKRPKVRALLQQHLDGLEKELPEPEFDMAAFMAGSSLAAVGKPEEPPAAPPAAAAAPTPVPAPAAAPKKTPAPSDAISTRPGGWNPPQGFGFEQGEYNTPWMNVMVSIENVGSAKDRVTCEFTKDTFDLQIRDLDGKDYRLRQDPLDKDIIPSECKFIVKKNRVTVKLKKVKGEYSYENWTNLTAKGGRAGKDKAKQEKEGGDPGAGIMDMMKDMYEDGDDSMRKVIGEAMLKSKKGEAMDEPPSPPSFGDSGFGGGGDDDDDFGMGGSDYLPAVPPMPPMPSGMPPMPKTKMGMGDIGDSFGGSEEEGGDGVEDLSELGEGKIAEMAASAGLDLSAVDSKMKSDIDLAMGGSSGGAGAGGGGGGKNGGKGKKGKGKK